MKKLNLILAVIMTNTICFGQIIHVPDDQPTIQAGINAASNGDTVLVEDGTYYENIAFIGKSITVGSHYIIDLDTNHISNTIIDGSQPIQPDTACVVIFCNGEDTTSVIQGFTITGGTGLYSSHYQGRIGGGIVCWNAGAKILNNIITENEVISSYQAFGGGIANGKNSGIRLIVIENNTIINNAVKAVEEEALGGGIFTADNARICNNIIEFNSIECDTCYARGGGISCYSFLQLDELLYSQNNNINNNTLIGHVTHGGGVRTFRFDVEMYDNLIESNTCSTDYRCYGSGVIIGRVPNLFIAKRNEFLDNSGPININTGAGGGLSFAYGFESEIIVDGNLFKDNTAKFGGGFYAKHTYNISLINNLFTSNQSVKGGGINIFHNVVKSKMASVQKSTSLPVIVNNTFYNNHANEIGGAIRLTGDAGEGIVTFNNIFSENEADIEGDDVYNETTNDTIYVSYSNVNDNGIYGLWSGDNNINGNPNFVDPENGDFHLLQESPCVGFGIDSLEILDEVYYCPNIDFENDPRPMPNTAMPDMGIDEIDETVGVPLLSENIFSRTLDIYPNPVSKKTNIEFSLIESTAASISIIDINGNEIAKIFVGKIQKGDHKIKWETKGIKGGIYFCVFRTNEAIHTKKIIKL